MVEAVTFVALVALALFYVGILGPALGTVAWLLTYAVLRSVCRVGLRLTDPANAFARERAMLAQYLAGDITTAPTSSTSVLRSTSSPRLLRSRMAGFASRLPPHSRSRP